MSLYNFYMSEVKDVINKLQKIFEKTPLSQDEFENILFNADKDSEAKRIALRSVMRDDNDKTKENNLFSLIKENNITCLEELNNVREELIREQNRNVIYKRYGIDQSEINFTQGQANCIINHNLNKLYQETVTPKLKGVIAAVKLFLQAQDTNAIEATLTFVAQATKEISILAPDIRDHVLLQGHNPKATDQLVIRFINATLDLIFKSVQEKEKNVKEDRLNDSLLKTDLNPLKTEYQETVTDIQDESYKPILENGADKILAAFDKLVMALMGKKRLQDDLYEEEEKKAEPYLQEDDFHPQSIEEELQDALYNPKEKEALKNQETLLFAREGNYQAWSDYLSIR